MGPDLHGPVVPEVLDVQSGSTFPAWLSVWKEARSAARQGDLAGAVQSYQKLMGLKANVHEAGWELARIRVVQGKYELATDLLDELPAEYRQRLEVLGLMALVQEKLGHRNRAVELYKEVLTINQGNAYALSGLVRCLLAGEEKKDALPYLEQLYDLGDQDREVAGLLAGLYFDLNLYKQAVAVLQPLVTGKAVSVEHLLIAARSEALLGDKNAALNYWKKVLTLDGHNEEARRWLAAYYEDEGHWQKALDNLLVLRDILPRNENFFLRIARCYVKLDELEKGLQFVNHYLDHQPHDKDALRFLVNINASLGREEQTLAALDRYFAVEPRPSAEKLKQAARLYDAQGRYREAIPIYKKLISNNPGDSELLKTLAEDLLAIGEDEGALHILNQLAAISPEKETYQAMVALLEKLGRRDELILVLERLHIKDPTNPETVLRLISLYLQSGDTTRAEVLYREISDNLLASPMLLKERGRFALAFGFRKHALGDYWKFLQMQYDREICLVGIEIAGRLGAVNELKRYTALFLEESIGQGSGGEHSVADDLLRDRVFRELSAADYLGLAKAWRQAFLFDTSRKMYRRVIDRAGASSEIRVQAFCGLAELSNQEGLLYEMEEAYRMAMTIGDGKYHIMGRLAEISLENGKYEKAATWLSLMNYVSRGHIPEGLLRQLPGSSGSGSGSLIQVPEAGMPEAQSVAQWDGGDWYRDFLSVKLRIARGAFRDAVTRGEILAQRMLKARGSVNFDRTGADDSPSGQLLVRLKKLLAVVHIYLHEFEKAEQIIAELDSLDSSSPLSEVLEILLVRERGGDYDSAWEGLLAATRYDLGQLVSLHDILYSLQQSGIYRLANGYIDHTRQIVLDKNRENLRAAVLLCRSAEANGEYGDALVLCRNALNRFPGNSTLESLAAFLHYRMHMYEKALSYCNQVLAGNVQRADMILLKARIIWRSDREEGLEVIDDYLEDSTEELIRSAAAKEQVVLPPRPEKSLWEKYREKIIRQEEARKTYLDTIMEPDFLVGSEQEDVLAVVYRYYARYKWQRLFREEAAARKAVMQGKYFRAAHHLTNLLSYEKHSDTFLLFDLARVYGKLGRIEDEAFLYSRIKRYDPQFPGLDKQIRRNQLQLRPRFALTYDYRKEEGWDGYKAMEASRGEVSSRFIFSPREDLQVSASHIRYDATAGGKDSLSGKRLFLSSKGSIMEKATYKLGAGVEFLNYDNSRTGLFFCRVDRKFADDFAISLSYDRDIVADTYASLTRNVVSDNSRAAISWDISSFFSAGGDYGLVNYSDSNRLDEYSLWTKCHIFGKPSYLTFTYQYSFKDAEESEVRTGRILPDGFHADDHPYWSPRDYWENSFSLNWKQPISKLLMEHESPSYYSASFTLDYDERGQVRQSLSGGLYVELGHHFIGRSSIKYTASENYDVREFSLAAIYRW